ncbi:hypothetical protein [Pontibacter silvestris]|uniref:hypothetical protein n=1 Tax=Pontibacter silvestris TaxID=2305183 RepID=UPI00366BC1FD
MEEEVRRSANNGAQEAALAVGGGEPAAEAAGDGSYSIKANAAEPRKNTKLHGKQKLL